MNTAAPARRRDVLLVFFLALGVRLTFVNFYSFVAYDSALYKAIAVNLISGHGFSGSSGLPYAPNLFRTPIYPYVLAIFYRFFGTDDLPVYVAQAVIGSFTCCLAYLTCASYFGNRVALVAASLLATNPFSVYYVGSILTETLYTFLITCSIYSMSRTERSPNVRMAWCTGFGLGVAMLCRPEATFLLFLTVAAHFARYGLTRRSASISLAILGAALVTIMPWLIRNYRVTGEPTPLVNRGVGVGFWAGTYPDGYRVFRDEAVVASEVLANGDELAAGRADRRLWKAGIERAKQDLIGYSVRRAQAWFRLWTPSGDFLLKGRNQSFKQAFQQGEYGLIAVKATLASVTGMIPILFAAVGAFAYRHEMVRLFPVWIPVLSVGIVWAPFFIETRYVISAQPFIFMFSACGIVRLWDRLRRKSSFTGAFPERL